MIGRQSFNGRDWRKYENQYIEIKVNGMAIIRHQMMGMITVTGQYMI